jgi:hypothetical protein
MGWCNCKRQQQEADKQNKTNENPGASHGIEYATKRRVKIAVGKHLPQPLRCGVSATGRLT